jgi:hypothetical protein
MFRWPVRHAIDHDGRRKLADRDLLPVLALFWLVSVVRVVGALVRRETFGVEATLAMMAVVVVPCVVYLGRRPMRRDG